MTVDLKKLDQCIARYSDFPKKGITFYDISPVLEDAEIFSEAITAMSDHARSMSPDYIAGIDARGFLFAAPIALRLGLGLVMIRKQGKLPGMVSEEYYDLEYGNAALNLQKDRNVSGKRMVIVDDLLATGGTLNASSRLITQSHAIVAGVVVLIELTELNGRSKLNCPVQSIQSYKS